MGSPFREDLRPLRDAQRTKERIRQAVDICDVVSRHVTLKRAGANLKGLCPFHQEKSPSFTVHPAKQIFKCFGCGAGGDVFDFVQRTENVGFREALEMLADQAGIVLEPQPGWNQGGRNPGEPDRQTLLRVTQWAAGVYRGWLQDVEIGERARAYIARRGINQEMVERFRLGFAQEGYEGLERRAAASSISRDLLLKCGLIKTGTHGRPYDTFRNRVLFPIVDPMDRVIGFGGRALGDDPPKYLNSPESAIFDKGRILYGLDLARRAVNGADGTGRIIVVEGYTDCVMAHQYGFTETVATMGTALTAAHVSLLKRYTDRIVLLFDSDEAGQRASERALAATLTEQLDVRLAFVPEGKDPCDFLLAGGAEALTGVLDKAVDAMTYKWRQIVGRHADASERQRREALDEYLDLVATAAASGVIDEIGRGMLADRVARVLSLPLADVLDVLRRRSNSVRARAPRDSGRWDAGGWDSGRRDSGRPVERPGVQTAWTPPSDAEQAALRDLLEVLCNDPSYYERVVCWFRPSSFADPRMGRIAQAVVTLIQTTRACELTALLSCFDDPADADLIVAMQSRGEQKSNFAQRVEGAVASLQRYGARRQVEDSARRATTTLREADAVRSAVDDRSAADDRGAAAGSDESEYSETVDAVEASLLALQQQARRTSGFAPRSVLRSGRVPETGGRVPEPNRPVSD